jgi:hypothetical protein
VRIWRIMGPGPSPIGMPMSARAILRAGVRRHGAANGWAAPRRSHGRALLAVCDIDEAGLGSLAPSRRWPSGSRSSIGWTSRTRGPARFIGRVDPLSVPSISS